MGRADFRIRALVPMGREEAREGWVGFTLEHGVVGGDSRSGLGHTEWETPTVTQMGVSMICDQEHPGRMY